MDNSFIWSDNWWAENEKAWFVDGETNILFQIDLNTQECKLVAKLPNIEKNTFRLNPRCIKFENDIFCMPDVGDSIWVYQLQSGQFKQIEINNPQKVRLSINNFWIYNKKILAVSVGLRQIIQIDVQEKRIDCYYNINGQISANVMVKDSIYCVSPIKNCIYQIDLVAKNCIEHIIPNIRGGLRTICFDGDNFWLSGYCKEIYIWNKENNMVKILDEFPTNFGIYNYVKSSQPVLDCDTSYYDVPTFISSVTIGKFVWFIPFCTNLIIYVDRKTYEINAFEIEEDRNAISFTPRNLQHEYLVEYIINNRYLGLFSLKNKCIVEIDTVKGRTRWKKYFIVKESFQKIASLFKESDMIFLEEICIYREVYRNKLLQNHKDKKNIANMNIGNLIYSKMISADK